MRKAEQAFLAYVKRYDTEDEKIHLKVVHTLHVAENAKAIAASLHLSQQDQDLAYDIGILHDIGRFEQIRKYQTFSDAKSENHAELGIQILKEHGCIRHFLEDDRHDDLIYKAIANHNRYCIEKNLNAREQLFTWLLRDAGELPPPALRAEVVASGLRYIT